MKNLPVPEWRETTLGINIRASKAEKLLIFHVSALELNAQNDNKVEENTAKRTTCILYN